MLLRMISLHACQCPSVLVRLSKCSRAKSWSEEVAEETSYWTQWSPDERTSNENAILKRSMNIHAAALRDISYILSSNCCLTIRVAMADYKPIPSDVHKDEHRDKLTFATSKRRAFLYLSILFNVISFGFILRKSDGLEAIFSNGIFGQDIIAVPSTINDDPRIGRCASSFPLGASPPVALNLWASLTLPETSAIYAWLEAPERNLNLTRSRGLILTDNVVYGIETYYPPKSEALAYLENSAASPPARFARVTIHHGGVDVPAVVDYLVGPLPVGPRTTIRPLKEIYHRDNIPFNARGFADIDEISGFLALATAPIAYVMEVGMPFVFFKNAYSLPQELFGGVIRGYENDTLVAGFTGPFSYDGSFRRLWMTWRRNVAGSYLLPVNFYTYIDISGTDTTQWKILRVSFSPFCNTIYLIYAFSSYIMTKYSGLPKPSLKHSTMVLSSADLSRPIPKSIIPGLKGNVKKMTVTLTIFLDLDLFRLVGYDSELIVKDNISAGWDGDYILASTGIWD